MVLARQRDKRLPRLGLDVGGVNNGELARREALRRDQVQHLERVFGGCLVVLVVADEPAADVGREHLRRLEVLPGEGRFPGTGRTDEHDERELGEIDLHRSNTAIWVGEPTTASSGPTPTKRTRYWKRSATARAQASNSALDHSKRWSL